MLIRRESGSGIIKRQALLETDKPYSVVPQFYVYAYHLEQNIVVGIAFASDAKEVQL